MGKRSFYVVKTVFSIQSSVFRRAMTLAKSSEFLLRRLKHVLLLSVLLNTELWTLNALHAKCFGTHGVIFPIEEQDPIATIQQKLKVMEDSGELERRNLELQKKARTSVERPKPVEGITKATKGRVFYYDPTYVVQADFKDHQGTCFAKKGTRINPLETVALSTNLIFFDGDDEEQLTWVKGHLATSRVTPPPGQPADSLAAQNSHEKPIKLILVKGAPLKLSEELNFPVYFDQSGILTQKLGIKHVPALVSQDGKKLKIEEIKVPPSRESFVEEGL